MSDTLYLICFLFMDFFLWEKITSNRSKDNNIFVKLHRKKKIK